MTTKALRRVKAALDDGPVGARRVAIADLRAVIAMAEEAGERAIRVHSLCPECGVNVKVDEDGLCAGCGATATGDALGRIRVLAPRAKGRKRK